MGNRTKFMDDCLALLSEKIKLDMTVFELKDFIHLSELNKYLISSRFIIPCEFVIDITDRIDSISQHEVNYIINKQNYKVVDLTINFEVST